MSISYSHGPICCHKENTNFGFSHLSFLGSTRTTDNRQAIPLPAATCNGTEAREIWMRSSKIKLPEQLKWGLLTSRRKGHLSWPLVQILQNRSQGFQHKNPRQRCQLVRVHQAIDSMNWISTNFVLLCSLLPQYLTSLSHHTTSPDF